MPDFIPTNFEGQGLERSSMFDSFASPTFNGAGSSMPTVSSEQMDEISQRTFNRVHGTNTGMSAWESIGRWAVGSIVDTADSLWSTPLNPFGERGDIWSSMSPEMQEYYANNKGLIEGTSAIVGGLGTAIAAETLIIPKLTAGLASSTAISGTRLWRAAEGFGVNSRVAMLAAQKAAAESGEVFSLLRSSEGLRYLGEAAAKGGFMAARTAPLDYALMWNNEAFNSGDAATEAMWISLGLGIGGIAGAVGARATSRIFANSDEIRNAYAKPMSHSGVMEDLVSADPHEIAKQLQPKDALFNESAYFTEFALASRSDHGMQYDAPAAVESKLSTTRNLFQNYAIDSGQKMLNTGITGVDVFKGQLKNAPELKQVVGVYIKDDPVIFHGAAEVGIPKIPLDEVAESRKAEIEKMEKLVDVMNEKQLIQGAQDLARKARILKNRDGYALINGQWMAMDSPLALAASRHDEAKVKVDLFSGGKEALINLPIAGKIRLDASLTPIQANGPHVKALDVAKLDLKDRMHLTGVADALVRKLSAADSKIQFNLTDKAAKSWFSLDMAAEILERGGKIQFDKTAGNIRDLAAIKRESLRLKATAVLNELGNAGRITPEIRFKYNLPQATAMEQIEDPAGDMFRIWLNEAASGKNSADDMAGALQDMRVIQGVTLRPPNNGKLPRIDGDMLNFNRAKDGSWMRPIVGYFEPRSQIKKISERGNRAALQRAVAERVSILSSGKTHVNDLARDIFSNPDELRVAMDTRALTDNQVTGLGGGIAQAAGEFLPNMFKWRDNPVILAAAKIQQRAERHARAVFESMMQKVGMQDIITRVTSSGHAPQRAMLDQYFSLRPGWDIDDVESIGNGLYGFKLVDTPSNRKRLGMSESEAWVDELMPNERTGKAIAVDDVALSAIQAFNRLSDELLAADNALRASRGLEPVAAKKYFAPVEDVRNKYVGFILGPDEKIIPGRTIIADTEEELNRIRQRTLAELGPGHRMQSKAQYDRLRTVWDDSEMDWIDPGIAAATAHLGNQKGGLTGAYVKQGAFNNALEWIQRKTMAQSQDTIRNIMRESILVADVNGTAEKVMRGGEKAPRNVYDSYKYALTGQNAEYRATSILDGKVLRSAEAAVNKVLADSAIAVPARHIVDLAERLGMHPGDLSGAKTYKQIAERMGPYTPFKSAMEYSESNGIRPPPTVKAIATKLNTLAASVFLRWLELPHALMNGIGLIATMPATVLGGRAPVTTFVNVHGQNIGIVDSGKIMANGMKRMFNKGASADWKEMLRNGDATQSVIEYHQQLGSIQSQAGFNKWAKSIDKWASIASEKSEAWSRQVAHFVGLELADYHGIKGMSARHDFAREIANAMIADYAPINRPELFGSGFGSLLGLFQSYGLNHYTKMFRWMETGQYGKMGMQAAIQASMFGVPGTYGANMLLDFRDSFNDTGEPTAVDMIYSRFGPVLGGAIVHGGVSELSRLALWTRGDMTPRIPGMAGMPPAISLGLRVANGFVDGVSASLNAMPGERANAMLEAVSTAMPNRVLKSWLILANGGNEIDAYGQVMSETRSWMDTVARTVGLRSTRQQAELEAFYATKGAMERDAARMEKVRKSFRAAVRNNGGSMENLNPMQYFNDYVKAGGNPSGFKSWVRNTLRDADSARSVQALRGSMSTAASALEVWRYGAYGAWDIE